MTLQKYALNHLSQRSYLPSARRRRGTPYVAADVSLRDRIKDKRWVLGLLLSYLGEGCGNWLALSFVSAAIVTPLGITSVVMNAFLAQKFLGEKVGERQRMGYALVALGILIILWNAPHPANLADRSDLSTFQLLQECCGTRAFSNGIFILVGLVLLLGAFLKAAKISRHHSMRSRDLYFLAAECSLLGAITVTCGKVLSIIARSRATSEAGALESTDPAAPSAEGFILGIIVLSVLSTVAAEFYRQTALTRFPVSTFQPVLFAGFNLCAVLSNILLFQEIPETLPLVRFMFFFLSAMVLVVSGLRIAQQAPTNLPDTARSAQD
ncbi:magnesium transporter [Phlyctochytrium arcticum]|nr:magnesium transporter [Phlyctochytrium arcticum]